MIARVAFKPSWERGQNIGYAGVPCDKKGPQLSICGFAKIFVMANYLITVSSSCRRYAKSWLQPQDEMLMGTLDTLYLHSHDNLAESVVHWL
jgi:hypothetical protein